MYSLQTQFEIFIENQYLKISKINDTCYLFPDSNYQDIQVKVFLDFYNSKPILTINLKENKIFTIPDSLYSKDPIYDKKSKKIQLNLDNSIKKPSELFDEINEILNTLAQENKRKLPYIVKGEFLSNYFNSKQFHYIELNKSNYSQIFEESPSFWFVNVALFTRRILETNEIEAKCFFLSNSRMFSAGITTFFDIKCSLKEIFEHFCVKFHGKIKITQGMYDACVESPIDSWIDFEIHCNEERSVIYIDDNDSGLTTPDFGMDSKSLLSCLVKTVQFRRNSLPKLTD